MSNVSAKDIRENQGYIDSAYHCEDLQKLIGCIVQDSLKSCWEEEWYIINFQHKKGDTHGWHWGDYPYTLIWIVEAPSLDDGGMLQCIPHTTWNKENPQINHYLTENTIQTYHHSPGDCYLLKSDTTLHRAMPITSDKQRIIVNTCWTSTSDSRSEDSIDRNSMLQAFV